MKRIPRPTNIKFSNFRLLKVTRNVHELINNQAAEYLQLNELSPKFKSIQYRVNKVLHDFETFQFCLNIAVKERTELYETIKFYKKAFKRSISKTGLYDYKNKFIKAYIYTKTYDFNKLIDKPRTPKNIKYVYKPVQLNEIAEKGDQRDCLKIFNLYDYLYKLRHKQIELKTFDLTTPLNLSFQALKKAINAYYQRVPKPIVHHKHALRKYDIPFGGIQFDVKVIGACDNKFGINIYCADMVDEKSGMVFGKASIRYPKYFLIDVFKQGYEFYSKYFDVSRARTDHAIVFKRTESLNTGEFNSLLTELGIIHQYSFGDEPETNGKIENVHLQLDKELLDAINKCATIDQAIDLINKWYEAFNVERTKSYKLWNHVSHKGDTHRMFLINSLTFDFSQYT